MLFVAYLVDSGYRSQTCKSYISAIRKVLVEDGFHLSEDKCLLTSMTRACKLKNDRVIARLPIQKGLLEILVKRTESHFESMNQPYLAILYCTMFITAYYGLFRVGEIATGEHPIRVSDVFISARKHKALFILRSSKMHGTESKPQLIKLCSKARDGTKRLRIFPTCPYRWLRCCMNERPGYFNRKEAFFVFRDCSPVKPRQMRSVLRSMLSLEGFNPRLYNTQSFRIG